MKENKSERGTKRKRKRCIHMYVCMRNCRVHQGGLEGTARGYSNTHVRVDVHVDVVEEMLSKKAAGSENLTVMRRGRGKPVVPLVVR